jgi:hypothetical protein
LGGILEDRIDHQTTRRESHLGAPHNGVKRNFVRRTKFVGSPF